MCMCGDDVCMCGGDVCMCGSDVCTCGGDMCACVEVTYHVCIQFICSLFKFSFLALKLDNDFRLFQTTDNIHNYITPLHHYTTPTAPSTPHPLPLNITPTAPSYTLPLATLFLHYPSSSHILNFNIMQPNFAMTSPW